MQVLMLIMRIRWMNDDQPGRPVTWQSKNQTSVALSTMEAEYMVLAAETQEAIWLRMVLEELGVE